MRAKLLLLLLPVFLLVLLSSNACSSAHKDLVLVYSGDVAGEYESCG